VLFRLEITTKESFSDPRSEGLLADARDLGLFSVTGIRVNDVYYLAGEATTGEIKKIAEELLADPITQEYFLDYPDLGGRSVEIAYLPGVSDPVAETFLEAISGLGIEGIKAVRTARRYLIHGELSDNELGWLSSRLLYNPMIEYIVLGEMTFSEPPQYHFELKTVDIFNSVGGVNGGLYSNFSHDELKAIMDYFNKLGRNPTDIELETIAQTWSEHCVHKTFKANIEFEGRTINNLLKSTIIKATAELNRPWCLSTFVDNSGVVAFDDNWAVCFKVETHNHPSAIEPYGGAATGIGGVVRDILGTGLSAKPIFNTDVFCFGSPELPYDKLPLGVLHPKRVFKGVRAGVADYGNRLGIPTASGALFFDERYITNPLVFCGTVGLIPSDMARPGKEKVGDLVVLVGGRTGRDGIGGVTFASRALDQRSVDSAQSSVQIGNPLEEKKVIDALLRARDAGLFSRITDCGGGGLSSAVGEMAAETGVRVDLEKVPLKYSGLSYTEIWISESQERMVLAVPPENFDRLARVFQEAGTEATVIGKFTGDRKLHLSYQGNVVGELEMNFLHRGRPPLNLKAKWQKVVHPEPELPQKVDLEEALMRTLGSLNVCSREWVIRQYDHEVQGTSVLKPLVGRNNDGPGDGVIIKPVQGSEKGLIISCGLDPKYGDIDPYLMTASAIDEALRQIIAVGGNLKRVALLDNFCWGEVDELSLGALVRAAQACYDMSIAYGVPFISGKDSLNNTFTLEDKTISIPYTILISAMSVMEDTTLTLSMDFKKPDSLIYIVGLTGDELGGSEYFALYGATGNKAPTIWPMRAKYNMRKISQAAAERLLLSCHDLSQGGLGVSLAEMAFSGGLGAEIDLGLVPLSEEITRDDIILFSESNSRFLVEVSPENEGRFEEIMSGSDLALIGRVKNEPFLEVYGLNGHKVISCPLIELKEAWQRTLEW